MELQGFDAAYLERLRTGEAETEKHFVAYFGELLRIKLRSRLRSRTQMEDARQETFLRVLRVVRSGGIREAERLGSFVNSVCNNVLLETYRSQGKHPAPAEERQPAESEEPGPEEQLISEERLAQVRRVLDELPERDRRLLRGLFLEERDKDELTAQFGVGRDYLRVLLHRAKQQFRVHYQARQAKTVALFEEGRRARRSAL